MRRVPDRFWWIVAAGGSVTVLESLVFLGWAVLALLVPTPFFSPFDGSFLLLLFVILMMFLAFPIMGFHARDRFRRRVRALQGDQEAMPRAKVIIHAAVPDGADEPLELRYRSVGDFIDKIFVFGIMALFVFFILPLCGLGMISSILSERSNFSTSPAFIQADWLQITINVMFGFGILVLLVLMIYVAYIIIQPLVEGTCQLQARAEGLLYTPQRGASRLLPWEEVRLVELFFERGRHIYHVYGARTSIAWGDPKVPWYAWQSPDDPPAADRQALLNLIARRTGLVPRTFLKGLMEEEAAARPNHPPASPLERREELQPS